MKPVKIPMTPTLMFVSVDARFARFGRPAGEMPKVPKSCGVSGKNWRMPGNWLLMCASANWQGRRCLILNAKYTCSAARSRR